MLKVSDFGSGLAVAGLGSAIFWRSRSFESVGVSSISPSFYPGLIGLAIAGFGLALAVSSIRRGTFRPVMTIPEWVKLPGNLLAVLSVPATIVFYGLVSSQLGFIATAALAMLGLLLAFRVSLVWSVVIALLLPSLLHVVFAVLMRVPLPYGFIETLLP